MGKRVKCPGCGAQLPVPGAPIDEETPVPEKQREWSAEEVRRQLETVVAAALRAAPPPPRDAPAEQSVSRSDLRRLKRSLANVVAGPPTLSQLDAAEELIEQIGRVPDPRIGTLLREHLKALPPSLFLVAVRVLADHNDPSAFEQTMHALATADDHTLPLLLQVCGRLNDPRTLQPLLIAAARCSRHRMHAIEALSNLGPAAASPLVRAACASGGETDDDIRCAAIEALEQIADPRTVPRLAKLAQDGNPAVRLRSVKALSAIESDAAVRPLVAALSDTEATVRAAAASTLARRPNPKLAPFLAKVLGDPDRNVRLHAVKGLGLCENTAVAPQLRPLLACGDEELALAAAESMARLGDDRIVPDMLDRLQREIQNPGSEPGTEKIIDALRRLRDDRAVLPLVEMLRHPRETIRARAAEALGQIGDPVAVDSLIDLLQRDFNAKVQAAAAKALGELKDPQAIPALEQALQHSTHVRCKALIALGEIGGRRALRSLIELTEDPAPTVRYHAANCLAKAGDRSALPALEALARDTDEMVRRTAVKAMQDLGDDRTPEEIVQGAQSAAAPDPAPKVKLPRPRFSVKQLLPDVVLGLASRRAAIGAGSLVAAVGVAGLVVWVALNWQTDTVVVRGYVSDVSLSGDGRAAAVMRTLGLFEIWDAEEHRATHQAPNLRFREVFFAPDGSSILGVGGNSLTLLQLDAAHRVTSQVNFQAPGETVTAAGTSPSGALVATVSDTGELVCWNIQSGEGEWTLQLADGNLQCLAVAEAGDRAAGITRTGELLVWDVASGELAGEYAFSGPPPVIRGLSFDVAGEFLAASSVMGDLYIWNTDDLRKPRIRAGQGNRAEILMFVDAEHLLVQRGNAFETWTVEGEQPQRFNIDVDLGGSLTAAATRDGTRVAVGADECSELYVYDVPSGQLQFKLFED